MCVDGRKRLRKRKSDEINVTAGWTQEWVSPNELTNETRLDIREVVCGPFSSPKLLRTQPCIEASSLQRKENIRCLRRGIPDTWREYVASSGYCGATEARVLQKNLIPCCVRSLATDRLWNDLGLPFLQGIPDPWKSRSSPPQAVRQLRRRCNKIVPTRGTCSYDGGDELETEPVVKRYDRYMKDHANDKEGTARGRQDESNLPSEKKNARNATDQLEPSEDMKSSSRYKRVTQKVKNVDVAAKETKGKTVSVKEKPLIYNRKKQLNKILNESNVKATVTQYIPPDSLETTKGIVQSVETQTVPNIVYYGCMLQDYVGPNILCLSNHIDLLNQSNVSQRVLCKDCENIYRGEGFRRQDVSAVDGHVPNRKGIFNRHKIVKREDMYKRAKLKLCYCLRKTKCQLEALRSPKRVETRNATNKMDLNLICCRCDCPYLKITSPAPIDRNENVSNRGRSSRRQQDQNIGPRERRRISKCTMTQKQRRNHVDSTNHCGTCTENKIFVSKTDPEQVLHSTTVKQPNDALNKNVNEKPKTIIVDSNATGRTVLDEKFNEGIGNSIQNIQMAPDIDTMNVKAIYTHKTRKLKKNCVQGRTRHRRCPKSITSGTYNHK